MAQITHQISGHKKTGRDSTANAKSHGMAKLRAVKRKPVQAPSGKAVAGDAYRPDARAMALLQGVKIAQQDLREAGGAYTLEQVRLLLQGISRQAVDKRVQEGTLLAVPGPGNRRAYPTIQFLNDGRLVDGLKAVRQALGSSNPWLMLNFLSRPDPRLDNRKPIDLLRGGEIEPVLEAARLIGMQGA